nr:uncharacterized protein LOC109163473 [Ipomoea batatas]
MILRFHLNWNLFVTKQWFSKFQLRISILKIPAKPIPVLKITNDDELVSVYCPSLTDDHDELSKMIGEELQDEESDNFTTWLVVQVDGAADMICGCVGLCSLGEPERVYIDAGEPEKDIIISPDVKRYQEYLRVLKTSFDQEFPNKTGNSPRTRVLASSPSLHKRENSEDKTSSGPTPLPVKLEAPPQTSSSKGKGIQQPVCTVARKQASGSAIVNLDCGIRKGQYFHSFIQTLEVRGYPTPAGRVIPQSNAKARQFIICRSKAALSLTHPKEVDRNLRSPRCKLLARSNCNSTSTSFLSDLVLSKKKTTFSGCSSKSAFFEVESKDEHDPSLATTLRSSASPSTGLWERYRSLEPSSQQSTTFT